MEVSDLEPLPPALGAGASRVFARRHVLRYRHPTLAYPGDFFASLALAFGPPPPDASPAYVLWHRATGTHFTVHALAGWAAYGGGLRFKHRPDAGALEAAYAKEQARRAALAATDQDPLLADLAGSAPSHAAHSRELERARKLSPPGFFDFLQDFEALVALFPPPEHRDLSVTGLDAEGAGAAAIVARGFEKGQYFERQPSVEEAHAALAEKIGDRPERLSAALFDWWSTQSRPPKPVDALGQLLLEVWRARVERSLEAPPAGDSSYSAEARARHEDHERAQQWMRVARLALLLPLAPADADGLASRASGLATQSTEYKKLDKLRRAARPPAR